MLALSFRRLYAPFGLAYLLSYLYRTITAVIAPSLSGELGLSPSELGLLTSSYFLVFGLAQIPVGVLLDRYGPRRIESALLAFAALAAFLFAQARSLTELMAARGLIGLGVAACLMAPLKAIASWFPRERQASLSGWMMVAGGAGALASTVPLELLLRRIDWRGVFAWLALSTVVVAGLVAWRVPDATPAAPVGWREQWSGVLGVLRHRRFWWVAPLAALGMGSFMAIQSLWAVPWLMEVDGLARAGAASQLSAMGLFVLMGYAAIALFGTRLANSGVHARHLVLAGFGVSLVGLGAIVLRAGPGQFLWPLYGVGMAANVLTYAALNEGFPLAVAGRANTALNLAMFAGSFVAQWGIGLIVEAAGDRAHGLRLAFAIVFLMGLASYVWFAWGFSRHAVQRGEGR